MEKEIWTIDDIIKDYENQGLAGRSKVDFLNDVKDFILKNTRYVQWSTVSAEEHEKIIKEIKEKIKDKDFGSIDYTNPGLPIDYIYMPKKYLKWEDLETNKNYKCGLNGTIYTVQLFPPTSCKENRWEVRLISENTWQLITEENKQFFNDLHLEVVE